MASDPARSTSLDPIRAAAGADNIPKMNMVTVIGSRNRPEAVTLAPKP